VNPSLQLIIILHGAKFPGEVIEYANTHGETKIVRRYIHPRPYANPAAKPQDSA
jgi:hypothetical protein